jgi:hypothetical protein
MTTLTRLTPLMTISALVILGCHDAPDPIAPAPTVAPLQSSSVIPEGYVATPAGLYHASCVHEVPSGAVISSALSVSLPSGATYQIPKCLFPTRVQSIPAPVPGNGATAWKEWTASIRPSNPFRRITARWLVPADPPGAASYPGTTKTYYTFPGLQTDLDGINDAIIQPVLQFGFNGEYGGPYWTIASWRCGNDQAGCFHTQPIQVAAGDTIFGDVRGKTVPAYWRDMAEGPDCAPSAQYCRWWTTTSPRPVRTYGSTTLVFSESSNYTFATSGAVETYHMATCADYPPQGVFYDQVTVYDVNSNPTSPDWFPNYASDGTPNCNFLVTFTATTANLFHGQ